MCFAKDKKKKSATTSSSHSSSSSSKDVPSEKQKRLLEASLFGDDESPPVKKAKMKDKEKHHKDSSKSKESKSEKTEKSRDSKEEKSEKSKDSKNGKTEKGRENRDSKDEKLERIRDSKDDKSVPVLDPTKSKKRDEEFKTKHSSLHADGASRSSLSKTPEMVASGKHGETNKYLSTSGSSSDQSHVKRHSSSDNRHHSKSHKERHRSSHSSSKSATSSELDGKRDKGKAPVRSSGDEKVSVPTTEKKPAAVTTQVSYHESLSLSETSDNEGTISESLTILAKSSQRVNMEHLFGSDDSMDSDSGRPLTTQAAKQIVEDFSPVKQSVSSKSSLGSSKDSSKRSQSDSYNKSKTKSSHSSEKSSSAKSDSKEKTNKNNINEFKTEVIKPEKKSGTVLPVDLVHQADPHGALPSFAGKQPIPSSPVKVKSEQCNIIPAVSAVPTLKDRSMPDVPSESEDGSNNDDSDGENSDESVVVDVESGMQQETNNMDHSEDPSTTDLTTARAPNGEFLSVLLDLQVKLMTSLNDDQLEQLTSLIEETGQYQVNSDTFDFDLCVLDAVTVKKIRQFVEQSA